MTEKICFTIPVPLSIASFIAPYAIRIIPEEKLPKEIKSYIIEAIPDIVKNLKQYKGLTLVDVETALGEKVLIKL